MLNKKGFTLIELLALMAILGVIASITIPNTIKLLAENKKSAFIQDSKRLIDYAEYSLQSSRSIKVPTSANEITVINLDYMNTNEFEKSSYGLPYNKKQSFVVVINQVGKVQAGQYIPGGLEYFAVLIACNPDEAGFCIKDDKNHYSVVLKNKKELVKDDAKDFVKIGDATALGLIVEDDRTPIPSTFIGELLNNILDGKIYSSTVEINSYLT